MARAKASSLAVKQKRLSLVASKKPVFESLGDGVSLGYRRNNGAGSWVARLADGRGGSSQKVIGRADDYQEADGDRVLTWAQAQARAFAFIGTMAASPAAEKDVTVEDAIARYVDDLKLRGGDPANAARVARRVPADLMSRRVADLRKGELRGWRDGLAADLRPSSINRTCNALRAALNLAAGHHDGIKNGSVWERDLAALPDASTARNVIISDELVRALVNSSYLVCDKFGHLVETVAVTGARYSQVARLCVRDLQNDEGTARLMLPSSKKGKGTKRVLHRPVPIPASLASKLRVVSAHRPEGAHLLLKAGGEPWKRSDHTRLFARAVRQVRLSAAASGEHVPDDITIYALRHSNIARQILRGVPIRVIAIMHDTSVSMIEKNYSAHLADHSDSVTRSALLEL